MLGTRIGGTARRQDKILDDGVTIVLCSIVRMIFSGKIDGFECFAHCDPFMQGKGLSAEDWLLTLFSVFFSFLFFSFLFFLLLFLFCLPAGNH